MVNHDAWGGAVSEYLNSTRGRAFEAYLKAVRARGDDFEFWEQIELAATHSDDVLRVGALERLLSIAHLDTPRAMKVFGELCHGHPEVLRSGYAHQLLYWILHKHPLEAMELIRPLMNDPSESMAQEGAQMAAVAALRRGNIMPPLLSELLSGPPAWRRGVAAVASAQVTHDVSTEVLEACCGVLKPCLSDEDDEVRRHGAHFVYDLKEKHIVILASLIETLVRSAAYNYASDRCGEFLFQYGDLEPDWTLHQIEVLVRDVLPSGGGRMSHGNDELCRALLRLYNLPEKTTDAIFRARCMNAFGDLMEFAQQETASALKEWDEGRFS